MICQHMNICACRRLKNRAARGGMGRGHVQRRRQSLRHERRHADASLPDLAPAGDLHGVTRGSIHFGRAAWPVDHPFCAMGAHQARSMAGPRPGQAETAKRLHAVLQQLQRHLGPIYRRFLGRDSQTVSTFSGIRARDTPTRSRSRLSRIISGRIRSTRITTTMRRQAPRNATSRRRCA